MPSITHRTITKPSVQTVESTIKAPLQGKKRYLRKKLKPITTTRTRDNIYIKPPALPTKKVHKKTQILRKDKLLPFLYSLSSYIILLCSDLSVGDIVAGTTPVTILKGAASSLTQAPRQGVGHIWAHSI